MSTPDNTGDKSGEASMDEILASIRKIIADDPAAQRGGPDLRAVNPLLEPQPATPRSIAGIGDGPLLPPVRRFGDELRANTEALRAELDAQRAEAAVAPPPVRARPFADHVLSELVDDPSGGQPFEAPDQLSENAATKAASVNGSLDQAAPQAPDPWAAWRSLRPAGASNAAAEATTADGNTLSKALMPLAETSATAVEEDAVTLQPPAAAEPPPVNPSSSPAARKPGFYPPLSAPPLRRQAPSFSSVFPRGQAPAPANAPLRHERADKAPAPIDTSASEVIAPPTMTALNGSALKPLPPNDNAEVPEATLAISAVAATAAAGNHALEKLAAGLTETVAKSSPDSEIPAPLAPAPLATEPAAIPRDERLAAAPSVPTSRTLDDMVSDMLRPMLERWVETNMPRLMEKALRPASRNDTSKS